MRCQHAASSRDAEIADAMSKVAIGSKSVAVTLQTDTVRETGSGSDNYEKGALQVACVSRQP